MLGLRGLMWLHHHERQNKHFYILRLPIFHYSSDYTWSDVWRHPVIETRSINLCSSPSNRETWKQWKVSTDRKQQTNTFKQPLDHQRILSALAVNSPPDIHVSHSSLCYIYRAILTDRRPCGPRHCCQLVASDKKEQGSHIVCSLVWLFVLACSVARWGTNERTGSSLVQHECFLKWDRLQGRSCPTLSGRG